MALGGFKNGLRDWSNKKDFFSPVLRACVQCSGEGKEVRWRGGGEAEGDAGDGVGEAQRGGVQGLAGEV